MEFSVTTIISLTISACLIILSIKLLTKPGWLLPFFRGVGGMFLLYLGVVITLAGINLSTFAQLRDGGAVANISFEKLGRQHFKATIVQVATGETYSYPVYGDMWQLDVKSMKLPFVKDGGFYRVSGLTSRYYSIEQQRSKPATNEMFPIDSYGVNLWKILTGFSMPTMQSGLDQTPFFPIDDSTVYTIRVEGSGVEVSALGD